MKLRYAEAINRALREEMVEDPSVVLLGEDIAEYGGVFQATKGLLQEFGPARVVDTPISENGIVGAAVAMAMDGLRPVVEIMYADFLPLCLDSLSNGAAVFPYIYGDQVRCPLVVRTQGGAGAGAGAQHSKMLEVLVAHIPGLRVVAPSNAADAYSMTRAAVRHDDPVVLFEHKLLYNTRSEVPDLPDVDALSKATVVRPGEDVSLVSWSRHVAVAVKAAAVLEESGISAEVVDLRSLRPLDDELLLATATKTGRVIVVGEAWTSYGPTAEIACRVYELAGAALKAPVVRIGATEMPIGAAADLEAQSIPSAEDCVGVALELCKESV